MEDYALDGLDDYYLLKSGDVSIQNSYRKQMLIVLGALQPRSTALLLFITGYKLCAELARPQD